MMDVSPHIGILYVRIFIPSSQTLKDKRRVLKRLKDRVRQEFNVSMAELDGQDKWQTATLGFAMIGNDKVYLDSVLHAILGFVDTQHLIEVCETHQEFC